jgi:hypothetical protein
MIFSLVELEPGRFGVTRPLWAGMGIHLAVESILAEASSGRVFVDDADEPRGAMIGTGHRLYLAGDASGLGDELRNFASSRGKFVIYPALEDIGGVERLLSGYSVSERGRLYYECDPTTRTWVVEPPEGYSVVRITLELLGCGLANTDRVVEEMCSERASAGEFLEKGFGFAVVHSGGFASWCMSEYNLGDGCEVGIETVEEYRRSGLAVLVAGAMFRHAKGAGIRRVGWHCWGDNAASVTTAERLGLSRITGYNVLVVDARAR